MIYPPYKNAQLKDVTQRFNNIQPNGYRHVGVDFAIKGGYGTFLVAPDYVEIVKITSAKTITRDFDDLQKGYGIRMRSVDNPSVTYLYWHCLPTFPVKEGDLVLGGEIVAEMGNSGNCYVGGHYVPLADRTQSPYKGTHLHYEIRVNGEYDNCLPLIDFSRQVKLNIIQSTKQIIQKLSNLIKRPN